MVGRNKPDPKALAAARAAADAKRASVGLPIEETPVIERRKLATEREVQLYAIRVAGYHGGASADVQKLRYRVGNEAYGRALREGSATA